MREEPQRIPPYVPYKTLANFVESLRQGLPGRIDRSLMMNMSGATQQQLLAALRYLSLVDEQGFPQESLERLVMAEGPEQQHVLKGILQASYGFLFNTNGFNLANATWSQFEERFRATGASGETIRKCISFFLAAAKEATITMSPRIINAAPPRASVTSSSRQRPDPANKRGSGPTERTGAADQPASQSTVSPPAPHPSGLTTRTVQLRSGGVLLLSITGNLLMLNKYDREFVFNLIETVEAYEDALGSSLPGEQVANVVESAENEEIPF